MGITVGRLGEKFGVSRTTLLYYDSIGLLKPSARSASGYRQYTDEDADRLRMILLLRDVGVPLVEIGALLPAGRVKISVALMRRLGDLNKEIEELQTQQQVVIRLLRNIDVPQDIMEHGRAQWLQVLEKAGLDSSTMMSWHADFEKRSQERHHEFLRMIGLTEEEIENMHTRLQDYHAAPESRLHDGL
jgi:MerR family transcriptional regulator, thiopeptide resistance regulator